MIQVHHGEAAHLPFSLDAWFKNKIEELSWEIRTAADEKQLEKRDLFVASAAQNLRTTGATEPGIINFAPQNVPPSLDFPDLSRSAKSVAEKLNSTETNIVQRLAQIKQDMEILIETLTISEKELTTPTTHSAKTQLHQNIVSIVERLSHFKDIIQICQDQLKLYGSVNPAIIGLMQQDITQSLLSMNLKDLPSSVLKTFPFLVCAKPSKAEKNRGCEGMLKGAPPGSGRSKPAPGRQSPLGKPRGNHHPTVKPVKLMSYLIAIGSRPGDLILDPFMGSGTTLVAAKAMGRRAVGVDNDLECIPVAEARVKAVNVGLF